MKEKRKERTTPSPRPPWLTIQVPVGGSEGVDACLEDLQLGTVCRSARCPNRAECYHHGRATFLLMGPHCTRSCRFCAVTRLPPAPLDPDEPRRVAEAASRLHLTHVVITSVTRDDLPDGGASHFAQTVAAVRARCPGATIEILVPDFAGREEAWAVAAAAGADVFNHNIETVPRLYPEVRPDASYTQSLALLRWVKTHHPEQLTKSGLMVGLGESEAEILQVGADLAAAGVAIVTVGQYLCPDPATHLPVVRYVEPAEFDAIGTAYRAMGFRMVASAPLVRSSYHAAETLAGARGEEGAQDA